MKRNLPSSSVSDKRFHLLLGYCFVCFFFVAVVFAWLGRPCSVMELELVVLATSQVPVSFMWSWSRSWLNCTRRTQPCSSLPALWPMTLLSSPWLKSCLVSLGPELLSGLVSCTMASSLTVSITHSFNSEFICSHLPSFLQTLHIINTG